MKSIFIILMLMLVSIGSVMAYTATQDVPAAYAVSTNAAVTFNITCVNTADSSASMNATVFWKTNKSGDYLNQSIIGSISNDTSSETSVTFADGDRVWWKGSCYDEYGEFSVLNESIVLVNATYNKSMTLSAVNATIDLTDDTYLIVSVVGLVNDTGGAYRTMTEDTDYNISNSVVYLLNGSLAGNTSLWTFYRHVDLENDTYKMQDVTGWVNDSGGDYRAMVLDSDYAITDGLVYILNNSIKGNTSLWTYDWPAMILNQTNTSVRVMDIDVDYYTLSFGVNKYINFSLDTGDIVTAGDITVEDITGTNLYATNLESNLDGTSFNVTIHDLEVVSINQTVGDALINMVYGEMWNYSANDTAWTFTITSAGIYYNMTGLTSGDLNGFTHSTSADTGSILTAQIAGKYKLDAAISVESVGNNELYGFLLAKNHDPTESRECYSRRFVSNQAAVGSVTISCMVDLAVDDIVALQVENEGGTSDIKVHAINVNALRIGD